MTWRVQCATKPEVIQRLKELRLPVVQAAQSTMQQRLTELRYAILLDPIEAFDEHGRPLSIREMPQHVRRAIAGYEVDLVSFVTKIRFVDKRGAIMDYSKLAGDIPREKGPVPAPHRSRFDLSKLTDAELKEHIRLRKKAMVEFQEGTSS